MSILAIKFEPLAVELSFTSDTLCVRLADGREVSAPLAWFPRLQQATSKQRQRWRLIGGGIGIHWDAVDEDISAEACVALELDLALSGNVQAVHTAVARNGAVDDQRLA